jgi:formate/nitrite transporter FocA (FNT family)
VRTYHNHTEGHERTLYPMGVCSRSIRAGLFLSPVNSPILPELKLCPVIFSFVVFLVIAGEAHRLDISNIIPATFGNRHYVIDGKLLISLVAFYAEIIVLLTESNPIFLGIMPCQI